MTNQPVRTAAKENARSAVLWAGAVELARRIADGALTSEQVVEAHLRQIELVEPHINAIAHRTSDSALSAARLADAAQAAGKRLGPLHGVPVSIKHMMDVAGMPSGWGNSAEPTTPATTDAWVVSQLRSAGAIVLAKTNVPQLGLYYESDNPVHGRTNNPWDNDRTSGGSSGGDAALVAAGGVPLGLASDLGGSIRVPAHFCGIHGLMPTAGTIRLEGVRAMHFGGSLTNAVGPLARRVEDLRLVTEILLNRTLRPAAEKSCRSSTPLAGMKIGLWAGDEFFPPSLAIRRVLNESASALEDLGATIVPFVPADGQSILRMNLRLLSGDGGAAVKSVLRGSRIDRRLIKMLRFGALGKMTRSALVSIARLRGQSIEALMLESARRQTVSELWEACEQLSQFRHRFRQRFDDAGFHALLLPPFGLPAIRHGTSMDLLAAGIYPMLANLLGYPAGTVTVGSVGEQEESDRTSASDPVIKLAQKTEAESAGLPVGVQVMATKHREDIALTIMKRLEQKFGGAPIP